MNKPICAGTAHQYKKAHFMHRCDIFKPRDLRDSYKAGFLDTKRLFWLSQVVLVWNQLMSHVRGRSLRWFINIKI